MFAYASKAILSFLLLTAVSASPVELAGLAVRQGGCIGALRRGIVDPGDLGRISFQTVIDRVEQRTIFLNNQVTAHLAPSSNVATDHQITVEIINSASGGASVLLTNYLNTLTSTAPREQIRLTVEGRTNAAGVIIFGRTIICVELPRLDGTWYIQVER
ncbi:hypothetical protein BKA65DRAFT_481191 [Rhexocercosporidium sp. MPI-PUGE-AT-0058]|nr:hypothetical protein BKA65DRAFT_481191 [Rhexocercosporidium sp. MPI-PUGE-AT-0058]